MDKEQWIAMLQSESFACYDKLFSLSDVEIIGRELAKNKVVKRIRFIDCKIGEKEIQILGEALKTNTSVKELAIVQCGLRNYAAECIAKALMINQTISELDLSFNEIGKEGAQQIAKALLVNQTVSYIDFSNNKIGDDGAQHFANAIQNNKMISILYLSGCNIGDKGAMILKEVLKTNKSVRLLSLSKNKIGSSGALHLAQVVEVNNTLAHLLLSDNMIWDSAAKSFAKALCINQTLLYLDLSGNNTTDKCPGFFLKALRVNFKLRALILNAGDKNQLEMVDWYLRGNKVCARLELGLKYRNRIPKGMQSEEEMHKLLSQLKLENTQRKEAKHKKQIANDLLGKAFALLDEEKHSDAKCYLDIATDLDPLMDSVLRDKLRAEIEEKKNLSEYDIQMRVEARLSSVRDDIQHVEARAQQTRSEEEKQMIEEQLKVLQVQEERLKKQMEEYEAKNKRLQEREAQVEQREQLLSEQVQQLQQMLAEMVQESSVVDVTTLQQQMSAIVSGDKDVGAARLRFESMQKSAKMAQQALVMEERRQRERVELLQKQIELYKLRGMSPEQKTFRNFLKDVKRLSSVRHQIEHTPHPLQCFISYAWETDAAANKELQQRLQRLKDDLETAGMKVKLDIRNMKYDMKKFMVDNIQKAHKLLLVCTPRLQVRATDPVKNNLQLELETALDKEKTTPEFITPLLFSGSFSTSMPPQVSHLLSLSLTPDTDYHTAMSSLAPMGLIPMLLGLEDNKDYKRIHERMALEFEEYEKAKL